MRLLVVAAALAALTGCGGGTTAGTPVGNVRASCIAAVGFGGKTYTGESVKIAPSPAGSLGSATVPACNDTPGSTDAGQESVGVSQIEGVSPDVAIMRDDQEDAVYIRGDLAKTVDGSPALRRLVHGVECDPVDAPLALSGRWRGIQSADGTAERDLETPYDVWMLVSDSSNARYERAFLFVRVPATLDRPLTADDVTSSLWAGGTIDVTVHCADGRFVAERIQAHPPRAASG